MTVTVRLRPVAWFILGTLVATAASMFLVRSWEVGATPAASQESNFVPITPCRLADTRQAGQGGPIAPGDTRTFEAHGVNGSCFIPSDAVALSLNVTADGQTAPNSFLTIWPHNTPRPTASSLNPAAGEPPTPNAVITDLAPAGRFDVYNDAGFVHVIIDVNGYFTTSSMRFAKVDADANGAALLAGTGIDRVSWVSTGTYQVDFVDPVTSCAWFATINDFFDGVAVPGFITVERPSQLDVDTLWVTTYDVNGVAADRPNSDGFSLHVVC